MSKGKLFSEVAILIYMSVTSVEVVPVRIDSFTFNLCHVER